MKAVRAYTEALNLKCSDDELNTILYTNRAAANFYLRNNRLSLEDAKVALKLNPNHMKAIVRAALSCYNLGRYQDAMDFCTSGMKLEPSNTKLMELASKADKEKRQCERVKRKAKAERKKEATKNQQLFDAIQARGIQIYVEPSDAGVSEHAQLISHVSHLKQLQPGPHDTHMYLDENGVLHWPVVFLYPEYRQSDFIQDFSEQQTYAKRYSFSVL